MSLSLLLLHLLQLQLKHHVLDLKLLLEIQDLLRVHLLVLILLLVLVLLLLARDVVLWLSSQLVVGESCKLLISCRMLMVS
jgi:hypothetical protein